MIETKNTLIEKSLRGRYGAGMHIINQRLHRKTEQIETTCNTKITSVTDPLLPLILQVRLEHIKPGSYLQLNHIQIFTQAETLPKHVVYPILGTGDAVQKSSANHRCIKMINMDLYSSFEILSFKKDKSF